MLKAAIFDLDGTLADTMPDLFTAMNAMLRELGYPERTLDDLYNYINKGSRRFVGQALPEGSFDDYDSPVVTEAVMTYGKHYSKCYADRTSPYPGIAEALAVLKERGIKLGVLSNKHDTFVKVIVDKLYPDVFDSVHGQLDLPEKPDPAPAFQVAEELGVSPDECAFIGDSDVDMLTAKNAGMVSFGVTWGYRSEKCLKDAGAKFIVRETGDLADSILSY